MFQVINSKTGKAIKNALTTKPMMFETQEHAQKFADSMHRNSVLCATAWNNVRRTVYSVSQVAA